MSDTVYKLQQRVTGYSTEAQVYTEGNDRINIEIPGVSGVAETNQILEDLGRPGSLYFIRQTDADGNENYQLGMTEDGQLMYVLTRELEDVIATGDAVLSGTDVADAQAGYQTDQMNNQEIVVSLTFTDEGRQKFADATTKAYAAGESIGIYYDGHFISVPMVQAAITDGRAVITGESDIDSARNLASTIRIGGLKVELERLRSQIVGAQLGQDAIATSKKAGIIGFALVALFMICFYLLPGFCAVLALCIYVLLIALVLNGFNITLTLPGIAGILLSIGMAVDANVIIFARIREEISAGRTVRASIRAGFSKALSAIIDGNVTTLIAAAVLGFLGSGTIKGFAYTLAIGIILSMFTALFITRFLLNAFYGLGLQDPKFYGKSRAIGTIDFTGRRNAFIGVGLALICAGLVAMGVHGARGSALNLSLDFVGGTSTSVTFNENMDLEQINSDVVPVFRDVTGDATVQVQKVAGTNEVIFKTRELSTAESTEISNQLVDKFTVDKDSVTSETISSTISSEMKRDAVLAVIVALILMLIYIWFRFKDIRFGASSVLCLAHDTLVVLAAYAILRISVGSTFIACMLTIVGYSINATIVVFDRIRENMRGRRPGQTMEEVVNESVTQTITRSLFTSLTTFFMVLTLYIFGVATVKEFALPIMVGIVAGCFSSVCLAGPVWLLLRQKLGAGTEAAPARAKGVVTASEMEDEDYNPRLSRKERREKRRKETEARNKAKTVI